MPNMFQLNIPTGDGPPTTFALGVGDVLYVLGANGTGKSSLVSRLFNQHRGMQSASPHTAKRGLNRTRWI
jgi:ABC-type Mn2+/Zn2+ transport system ATPase subunit